MQLRQSQLPVDAPRPVCPTNPSHAVHKHGGYLRLANYISSVVAQFVKIARWLCVPCGRTISVLPDDCLPYRQISASALEKHFDALATQAPTAPASAIGEGCLKRAWRRFALRLNALALHLGQMMQRDNLSCAKRFWLGLRRLGNLQEILRRLSADFHTSLLCDYSCIRPWAPP